MRPLRASTGRHCFGAGVELGQVAFLAVVLGVLHLARGATQLPRAKLVAVYAAGAVSMWWLVERASVCLAVQG